MPNLSFKQMLKSFKKNLIAEKGYSELTIKNYKNDLQIFKNYLKQEWELEIDSLDSLKEIDRIQFYITEFLSDNILINENSAQRRNRLLFALRSFFRFLVKKGLINNDPTEQIDTTKTKIKVSPIYIKEKDFNKFLKTVESDSFTNSLRNEAILKILTFAGLRVSELINLKWKDIDFDEKIITVTGKGKKERLVPLLDQVIETLERYKLKRDNIIPKKNEDENIVFLSQNRTKFNPSSVWRLVKKYAKKSQINDWEEISPHKLRHTFASLTYKKTKDIRIVQQLLGHSNISTTQIYTHVDHEEMKKAVNKFGELIE
ncbi:site-specific tyrosine recombinase XerD [Halanaerocella petrolearia]